MEVPVGANSKNAMVPLATVNTRNILFICGGAFPDLDEIIKERLTKTASIGFNSELKDKYDKDTDILSKVTVEDIRKFGMIPEFIGRLPIICTLQGLSKEMLVKILKEPKNAILKQYQKLLELDEVKLEFTDDALDAIAEKAMKRDTGARALRSIIEDFMLDIMYEIPKDDNIGRVTITREYIEGTGGPIIDIRSNEILEPVENLKQIPVEEKALRYVAKAGDGSMRDALSILDQCVAFNLGQKLTYDKVLETIGAVDIDTFARLLECVLREDVEGAIDVVDEIVWQGRELGRFVSEFTWFLRNILVVKLSQTEGDRLDMTKENLERIRGIAVGMDESTVIRYINVFSDASASIKYSTQKRIVLEMAVIKLCRPQMETDVTSIVEIS